MTDNNHEILDMQNAKAWLLSNLSKPNKASLYIDTSNLNESTVHQLLDLCEPFLRNFSSIVVNGAIPKDTQKSLNEEKLTNIAFIRKKIESPIKFSISIGRKSYFYLDTQGCIRTSTDDQVIGRILESIHSSLDSLAWG